jgi:hypothetical protein
MSSDALHYGTLLSTGCNGFYTKLSKLRPKNSYNRIYFYITSALIFGISVNYHHQLQKQPCVKPYVQKGNRYLYIHVSIHNSRTLWTYLLGFIPPLIELSQLIEDPL